MDINTETHKMRHVMVDIETLGVGDKAPIISVAAVLFNLHTGEYLDNFSYEEVLHRNISLEENVRYGFNIEPGALRWWLKTDPSLLSETIDNYKNNHASLTEVIKTLNEFCLNRYVWARSPSFDIKHLQRAAKACNQSLHINYQKEMDVRTLQNLYPEVVKSVEKPKKAHDAFQDCIHQIKMVSEIYKTKIKPSL
jgi:hypothetical protein